MTEIIHEVLRRFSHLILSVAEGDVGKHDGGDFSVGTHCIERYDVVQLDVSRYTFLNADNYGKLIVLIQVL